MHNDDARGLLLDRRNGGPTWRVPRSSSPKPSSTTARFGTRTVRFETGRLAKQAGGAVAAYLDDDTMLLSATTAGKHPKDQFDFFPLTVDVEERMYAAGKIPGSFFRREGRPSTDAILTCRLIDRPLRPTFVKGLRNEVQVVITVLSLNPDHQYDVLAINAASPSTQLSGLPFSGPIGGVRVALIDGQWVAFPNFSRAPSARLRHGRRRPRRDDTTARRRRDHDGRGRGHRGDLGPDPRRGRPGADRGGRRRGPRGRQAVHQAELCEAQAELAAQAAKPVQEFPIFLDYQDDAYAAVEAAASADLTRRCRSPASRSARTGSTRSRTRVSGPARRGRAAASRAARRRSPPRTASVQKKLIRQRILRDKVRIDGRGLADIRPLDAEVEVIPRVHGSAIFERGETQILGVTTLNMLRMEQQLDTLSPETRKRYMHNYNFPPYSHR